MAAKKALLVAKDSFVCKVKDEQHIVRAGETVSSDHPAAKQHPDLFEPAKETAA